MLLKLNQTVRKFVIVLLTSVLFRVSDCGDWDDIFVYENVTMSFPWHKNWTLITTTTTTTTTPDPTTTESPTTTEQQQQHTTMTDQSYGKRSENEGTFEFVLPKRFKLGDSLMVSGLLRENASTLTLSLVTGTNNGEVDFSNVAFEFNVAVDGVNDFYTMSTIVDNNREVARQESEGRMISDSTFKFHVAINQDSESEEKYFIVFHCNDSYLNEIESKHHLRDIRYLILTGDYEKVDKLYFEFAS